MPMGQHSRVKNTIGAENIWTRDFDLRIPYLRQCFKEAVFLRGEGRNIFTFVQRLIFVIKMLERPEDALVKLWRLKILKI